jgi:uncharacterized protein YbjQ (UPF0145 family)
MSRQRLTTFLFLAIALTALGSPVTADGAPDTLLILTNGAEVRGVFIELREEHYKMRLSDGRVMTYPASDVDRMERIQSDSGATPAPSASEPVQPALDPATCRVFITEANLDKMFYKTVKDIKVSKKTYGSVSEMLGALAEQALKVEADAVINVRTWHSPSGFAWAAPHAGGMAVKLTEAGRKALPGLEGRCY